MAIAAAAPLAAPALIKRKEQRNQNRRAIFRFGTLIMADRSQLSCIIKDISENGARIGIEGADRLPERLILKLNYTGARRRARVAWRRDNEAGLSFAMEQAPTSIQGTGPG
ncbi:MAG: PilZ domain-containing protein [Parvularculaceae bacterium]